jgi:hypothetical protein
MDFTSVPTMFLTTAPSTDIKISYYPSWNPTLIASDQRTHFTRKKWDRGFMTMSLTMNLITQKQSIAVIK